jgi:choline dehydrogenase
MPAAFLDRVQNNQARLASELKSQYDFIVCGSGSSGSVVARRLAEDPKVSVLLLEAGGSDDLPDIMMANRWPVNLESERLWHFCTEPSKYLNGRALPLRMGRVLGGGSSVNVMAWARGHKSDWDYFASEAGDPAWNYESILNIYRHIEDWHGAPDPRYRGVGGPIFVEPAPDPNPIALAMVNAAISVGIPRFESQNGSMMESGGGASIVDINVRDGVRQSVFRSYVYPIMDQPNLTVLSRALVLRLSFSGHRVTGLDISHNGATRHIEAGTEVILSLGAINTPKVLLQSGVGHSSDLQRFGIPVVQHLPGVGRNFQDHLGFDCVWEYREPLQPRNNMAEANFFTKSDPALSTPDIQTFVVEVPKTTPENASIFDMPEHGWTLFGGLVRPYARGQVKLTGPNPEDPVQVEANFLSNPGDLKAAMECVEICREVGNAAPLQAYAKREVMPGNLKGRDLENFVRNAVATYSHETCTAKMGLDEMSVVDADLKVYGFDNLRIADGSIMPRVTTGNTMAPCVVIGERAAEILRRRHSFDVNDVNLKEEFV